MRYSPVSAGSAGFACGSPCTCIGANSAVASTDSGRVCAPELGCCGAAWPLRRRRHRGRKRRQRAASCAGAVDRCRRLRCGGWAGAPGKRGCTAEGAEGSSLRVLCRSRRGQQQSGGQQGCDQLDHLLKCITVVAYSSAPLSASHPRQPREASAAIASSAYRLGHPPQLLQKALQILGQRRVELHRLAALGMGKVQMCGMKKIARQ